MKTREEAEALKATPANEATLRDIFAAYALMGYRANPESWQEEPNKVAKWSYLDADAMMEARKGGQG